MRGKHAKRAEARRERRAAEQERRDADRQQKLEARYNSAERRAAIASQELVELADDLYQAADLEREVRDIERDADAKKQEAKQARAVIHRWQRALTDGIANQQREGLATGDVIHLVAELRDKEGMGYARVTDSKVRRSGDGRLSWMDGDPSTATDR